QPLLIVVEPLWFHFDAQSVLGWIIVEAAPLVRRAIENDGPFIFGRNGMQAVTASRKFLPIDQNIVGDGKGSWFISAAAPNVAPGHNRSILWTHILIVERGLALGAGLRRNWVAPDSASFDTGTAVGNGHIGYSHRLHHRRLLARS